jgi:hypothetical protein
LSFQYITKGTDIENLTREELIQEVKLSAGKTLNFSTKN